MIVAAVLALTIAPIAQAQCQKAHRFPILWAITHPFKAEVGRAATCSMTESFGTSTCATCSSSAPLVAQAEGVGVFVSADSPMFISSPPPAAMPADRGPIATATRFEKVCVNGRCYWVPIAE